jgi:hypothetical protein
MAQKLTCLVTIHGIEFQHPPGDDTEGYADPLHTHLRAELGPLLGDDPNRQRDAPGKAGAVYVESNFASGVLPENYIVPSGPGLARLGTWRQGADHEIVHDESWQRLVDGDQPIAHVALVYTNQEGAGLHAAAMLETAEKAAFSLTQYSGVVGAVRLLLHDTVATIKGDRAALQEPDGTATSLIPRRDIDSSAHHSFLHLLHPRSSRPAAPSGPLAVWDTIQDDIATYVCRNDIRADVRHFVHDAILRLCSRDDVEWVVINAHSQGTVVAYDVLRELPQFAVPRLGSFVTAGSPLRKYLDCFTWGNEAGCIRQIRGPEDGWIAGGTGAMTEGKGWVSFWDDTDPVADPLSPSRAWRPRQPVPDPPDPFTGLFQAHDPDSGKPLPLTIADRQVDNWKNSCGGGLQSHNYWDNQREFVRPLATILRVVSGV